MSVRFIVVEHLNFESFFKIFFRLTRDDEALEIFYFDKSWFLPNYIINKLGFIRFEFNMIDLVDQKTKEQLKIQLSRRELVNDFVHFFKIFQKKIPNSKDISSHVAALAISKSLVCGYLRERESLIRLHFCLNVVKQKIKTNRGVSKVEFLAIFREGVDLLNFEKSYPAFDISFCSDFYCRIKWLAFNVAFSSISIYFILRVLKNPWLANFLNNREDNISAMETVEGEICLGSFSNRGYENPQFSAAQVLAEGSNVFKRGLMIAKGAFAIHSYAKVCNAFPCFVGAEYPSVVFARKKFLFDVLLWRFLFLKSGTKNVLLWHKHSAKHFAIFEAVRLNGGVCSIWRRSFEGATSVYNVNVGDVLFRPNHLDTSSLDSVGISWGKELESVNIISGMNFSFEFDAACSSEKKIGDSRWLSRGDFEGLTVLVADGGATLDARWDSGPEYQIETYLTCIDLMRRIANLRFLFLPKNSKKLSQVIGAANYALLRKYEFDGRCIVIDRQIMRFRTNHLLAAEADICIHTHMVAGTVGVEFAMNGVRTVLLDREHDLSNILAGLPLGTVIFRDWSALSKILERSASNLNEFNKSSIGFWPKEVITKLESFGDGLGMRRIYSVLETMEEQFFAGWPRAKILQYLTSRINEQGIHSKKMPSLTAYQRKNSV